MQKWGVLLIASVFACEGPAKDSDAASSSRRQVADSSMRGDGLVVDSAKAVAIARPLVIRKPWSDSLYVRRFERTESGYDIELVMPQPRDPNVYNLVGAIVHVSLDGRARVLEHYQ